MTTHKFSISDISRIYLSRGDNVINHAGVRCDKFFGIRLKTGAIYWFDVLHSLSNAEELSGLLFNTVRCCVNDIRSYSYSYEKGQSNKKISFYTKDGYHEVPITQVKLHHDDFFNDTVYIKNAVKKPNGYLWWTINDLHHLLSNGWHDDEQEDACVA